MRNCTKRFVLLLVLLALALPGCEEKAPVQMQMATVSYIKIKPKRVTLTTELPGRTAAFTISDVRPQVTGIIQKRLFVEGSDVHEGDILYQIDPAEYQAAYNNAQANLQRAQANEAAARLLSQRYATLVGQKAVSRQEYDDAAAAYAQTKAEIAAARAALESTRISLRYTKVKAPISGRIGRSSVTEGALVTQNQASAMAVIQQLDPIYVDVTQSSAEILRLKRAYDAGTLRSSGEGAMQATLKLEDGSLYTRRMPLTDSVTGGVVQDADGTVNYERRPVIGTLKFSEVTVNESTGAVTIRAQFPNPDGTLLPGMYARAVIEEGVNEKAILIPRKCVVRNNRGLPVAQVLKPVEGQEGVFTPEPRLLTVDRTIGQEWLVTEGLAPGEFVLAEGLMHLRGNAPVKGQEISEEEALQAKDVGGDRPSAKTPENGNGAPAGNKPAATPAGPDANAAEHTGAVLPASSTEGGDPGKSPAPQGADAAPAKAEPAKAE